MQSLSRYNKRIRIRYLLCEIDLFSKYARVIPIKDKKGASIVNAFKKIISEEREPNKIWVNQGSGFYNKPFTDFMKINNIEMYSTFNEGKSVVAERFIKTLKNKIYKHMTAISKTVNVDVLYDIVNKYNNTVHKTIQIKPIDVTDDSFAEYNEESNKKNPKFKISNHVTISKYKNVFAKGYAFNWSEEVFVIDKINHTFPWTYTISDMNGEEITGSFYKKELQNTNQQKYRIEKIIKQKGNKLYVKWKGYNNSFNGWINKKGIL